MKQLTILLLNQTVGAVIFYHAQITIFGQLPFKGGFIGVDIFFVISGYLITALILNEIDLKGKVGIIMGAEGKGLRRLTEEKCDFLGKLPMMGSVECLNLHQ